jgi:eukaryotic-like serine/threonine-protein kinase
VPYVPGVSGLRPIGRGGSASVFLGHQTRFDRWVAVKVLHVDGLDPEAVRRFERECAVMGRLSDHWAVVTVYDSLLLPSGEPALITEHCPGGSLAGRVRAAGPLPVAEVVEVGRTVGRALADAHRQGITHRDVKPANILLRGTGEPALTDFGLSVRSGVDASGAVDALTPAYAAPETLLDGRNDARSDTYSFGATLYALLTGRPPVDRRESEPPLVLLERVRAGAVAPIDRPDVPPELADLVMAMLAVEPGHRPPDEAVVAEFDALAAAPASDGLFTELAGPRPGASRTRSTAGPGSTAAGSRSAAAHGDFEAYGISGVPGSGVHGGSAAHGSAAYGGSTAAGQRDRGRRRVAVVAAVAVVVLAAAGGIAVAVWPSPDPGPAAAPGSALALPTALPDAPTPAATTPDPTTPDPTRTPTPTPTPADVPGGYGRVTGSAGLSVAVPVDWDLARGVPIPSNSEVTDPADPRRLLRFAADPAEGVTVRAKVAALAHKAATRDGYAEVRTDETAGGVDWEFRFRDDDGVPTHVHGRYWRVGGTDYVVYAAAPERDWAATSARHLDVMIRTARVG